MKPAWDKNGIPIQHGDLIRTFHFKCGNRNQFLYHVVTYRHDQDVLEAIPYSYLLPDSPRDGGRYWLIGSQPMSEVIQGESHQGKNGELRLFWERKKVSSEPPKPSHCMNLTAMEVMDSPHDVVDLIRQKQVVSYSLGRPWGGRTEESES